MTTFLIAFERKRIPLALFQHVLSDNDLVVVILEHIDYFLKSEGKTSP